MKDLLKSGKVLRTTFGGKDYIELSYKESVYMVMIYRVDYHDKV